MKIKSKIQSINIVQTSNNINQNISKDLNDNSKSIMKPNDKANEIVSEYNIHELNDLEYSEALKKYKRNFFEYYSSIIKERHILFFSFCKKGNHNS